MLCSKEVLMICSIAQCVKKNVQELFSEMCIACRLELSCQNQLEHSCLSTDWENQCLIFYDESLSMVNFQLDMCYRVCKKYGEALKIDINNFQDIYEFIISNNEYLEYIQKLVYGEFIAGEIGERIRYIISIINES